MIFIILTEIRICAYELQVTYSLNSLGGVISYNTDTTHVCMLHWRLLQLGMFIKIKIIFDTTPCHAINNHRRFREDYCRHFKRPKFASKVTS